MTLAPAFNSANNCACAFAAGVRSRVRQGNFKGTLPWEAFFFGVIPFPIQNRILAVLN
jgi:hypothetical protein